MGNIVSPISGNGTSTLTVTIVPVDVRTLSKLTAEGGGLSDTILFEQVSTTTIDPDGSAIPICNEITYSEIADKVEYGLYVNDELVYSGYAYKYPDEDELKIELNDVISDYLHNHISFTEGFQEMDDYLNTFTIKTSSDTYVIDIYNAWDRPKSPILNDPISNEVDPRQYYFINFIDGYGDLSLYRDGYEIASSDKIGGYAFVAPRVVLDCGDYYTYSVRQGEDLIDELKIVYNETNKNYALYYINAYGGWDSLAIRGNVTRTDNIQSQTYKNKTNGKVKYLNTSTATWQLYTDDMNDGSKMHHLLESNEVYLHNLETDEITPVLITDSNCVYKNYANQGNTRFHYTINVEASNYKIRK